MKPAVEAIRETPSWARQSSVWLKVALWAYRYCDDPVPPRDDIAKALISSQAQRAPAKPPARSAHE
jgi:hypothetical protein